MSTFEGLISEIEGISVDQFEGQNLESRVYFLSHCHSDHMIGINSDHFLNHLQCNGYSIFTSELSSVILKNKYPRLTSFVRALSIEEAHTILIPRSPNRDETFISVSLITAGHCPGSVMFLFKTADMATILYTGDFRLHPKDLPRIKQLKGRNGETLAIDKMYFDSTFWSEVFPDFPSRRRSCNIISDVIHEWISKGKEYIVNINLPAYYGSEFLYKDVAKKLKMPIHVHEDVCDSYRQIAEMEGVFTRNPIETQIHSCTAIKGCSMRQLTCRDCTGLKFRQIRPTALRWTKMKEDGDIISENNEGFYVCYSSHLSLNELKGFIKYLKPKAIEPCVVPNKQRGRKNLADRSVQEKFYESINSFCESFLKVPCRMSKTQEQGAIGVELPHCGVSSLPLKTYIKGKIVYLDSDSDDELPIKNSRLMMMKQKYCK